MIPTDSALRADMMLNQPLNKVIPRLAVPTIFSMLITGIYSMADTFFVSQLGTSASAAVGVIFSAMAIIQAIGFIIGMGSGSNMSRALGAGRQEEAEQFVSIAFFTALGTGVAVGTICLLSIDPLVRFLGATPTIAPYAKDYATYIFYATPLMMCALVMNNLLRFQGMAFFGMIGMVSGGLLNIVLDPLFIFGLGMGTSGAALATAISQVVSFTILLSMTNLRRGIIAVKLANFKPSWAYYRRILYNGFPSLARQGIASVSVIILNTTAQAWGDPAIAAMSIVSRFVMFINASVIGFGQGFQPVSAFSYGAGKYARVRSAYLYCIKVSTVILLVLGGVSLLFAQPIVTLFRRDDAEVIRIGTLALQLQLCTLPLWGLVTMSSMLTQAIGHAKRSTLISVARQGIFLIPLLLTLPPAIGLLGLQMAQPLSDVLTFLMALLMMCRLLGDLKRRADRPGPPGRP